MKLAPILENGHDSRRGFNTVTYENHEEYMTKRREAYRLAVKYMRRRLRLKSGKPRISAYLMKTKIPQTFDKFLMPKARKACVLGAIHIGAGGKFTDEEVSWWKVNSHFDVFEQEWERNVKCPECDEHNCLSAVMVHLNDEHKKSNYSVGKWLKKYHL